MSSVFYFHFQILQLSTLFAVSPLILAGETEKPPTTITRTEIKVSRSLNPDDMQTLNVVTRDGSVAQLLVKKKDDRAKQGYLQSLHSPTDSDTVAQGSHYSRSIYSNWLPVSSLYLHPNIIRLDTLALLKNATIRKPTISSNTSNNIGNVIDRNR